MAEKNKKSKAGKSNINASKITFTSTDSESKDLKPKSLSKQKEKKEAWDRIQEEKKKSRLQERLSAPSSGSTSAAKEKPKLS